MALGAITRSGRHSHEILVADIGDTFPAKTHRHSVILASKLRSRRVKSPGKGNLEFQQLAGHDQSEAVLISSKFPLPLTAPNSLVTYHPLVKAKSTLAYVQVDEASVDIHYHICLSHCDFFAGFIASVQLP